MTMAEDETPVYVVCVDHDPVVVKIHGKANYLNCAHVSDFFDSMIERGTYSFTVDFSACLGMDSTFLGLLAGVATKAMRRVPPGRLNFANMSSQNKQLIRGLGLHHLPTVHIEEEWHGGASTVSCEGEAIPEAGKTEASAGMILEAHERLMRLNSANERRFQDVVKYLRREAEKDARVREQ
jgi:anti-sigma B factor antagonist